MTKLNLTITASDDNNLIFETRGGRSPQTRVIPRDANAGQALLEVIETAIKANERPQPAAAKRAEPAEEAEDAATPA